MKMIKQNILFLTVVLFSLSAVLNSCKYDPQDWGGPTFDKDLPTVATDVATVITDTSFDLVVTPTVVGKAFFAVLPATAAAPTTDDLILQGGNVSGSVFFSVKEYETLDPFTVNVTTVLEARTYKWYLTVVNTWGKASILQSGEVTMTDDAGPRVVSSSPAHQSGGHAVDVKITLFFNEPVTYVEGKAITLTNYATGATEVLTTSEQIVVTGNAVELKHGILGDNTFTIITMEAGAFKDATGNENDAVTGFSLYFQTVFSLSTYTGAYDGAAYYQDVQFNSTISVTDAEKAKLKIEGFYFSFASAEIIFDIENEKVDLPLQILNGVAYGESPIWAKLTSDSGVAIPKGTFGSISKQITLPSVMIFVEDLGYFFLGDLDYTKITSKDATSVNNHDGEVVNITDFDLTDFE